MQKVARKIVVTLVLCLLLTIPMLINTNVYAQSTTLIVESPPEPVPTESFFDVYIHVDSFFDIFYFGIMFTYDTTMIDAVDALAVPPFETSYKMIDDASGLIIIEGFGGPVTGIAKLTEFRFKCTRAGTSPLTIADAYLADPAGFQIPIDNIINGIVTQTTWYFKPPYPDYAPSGVPDFDQKQLPYWTNPWPPIGTWSYCGPVAVANSLWWLDSEFEPNPIPPPIINDGFPLVQSYAPGVWDDHDPLNVQPLVDDLAFLMNTNGMRYGTQNLCGTEVHQMANAINEYLIRQGLDWKFYVHLQKAPSFLWIEDEVKKCQDVVLLLGFWQESQGTWWRVGGHYVTVAGVDSLNMMLAISDPYIDWAETGGMGRVLPPPPHPHTGIPETLHNDAAYVSHDYYPIGQSPSPGGPFGFYEYPAEYVIDNFGSCQNTPDEFIQMDGEYVPGLPIFTEIEYAVVTSCKTGIVAAGSEDTNIYVWDYYGAFQWQFALGNPVVSVAMDNNGRFIAAGTRSPFAPITGSVWLFDTALGGPPGNILWVQTVPVAVSYNGGWAGTESKSVDVKYNAYNGYVVVAAATDEGIYLYDQSGSLIWLFNHQSPETLVRISQDGNYIVCLGNSDGQVHYFSHMRNGVPGWQAADGVPVWESIDVHAFWAAISGDGSYIAYSGGTWPMPDRIHLISMHSAPYPKMVWEYILSVSAFWRVDMPCSGKSVVTVNDDPSDTVGAIAIYWDDGNDGWDGGDSTPVWTYWPGKETGGAQIPTDDFYTVAISENGGYVATGGAPANIYLLKNAGMLQQKMGLMPHRIQSVDLSFEGKYGAAVDWSGTIWFFDKDTGFILSWANPMQMPFHCVAVSKLYPCIYPYPNHDIKATDIKTCKDSGTPTPVLTLHNTAHVNATVLNGGVFTESFQVAVYANSTLIGVKTVSNLGPGLQTTLEFIWNTTGWTKGKYTLHVQASIVTDEIDVYDNSYIGAISIRLTKKGDVKPDDAVNVLDLIVVAGVLGTNPSSPNWNPNADVKHDHAINVLDLIVVAGALGT
ncbi:hypothetical protein HXY32_00760 [Candidatus Bathyarchaeota archaeon]|nr:hypothetical protein [Candidatus Bathyarchaeota archaeon]